MDKALVILHRFGAVVASASKKILLTIGIGGRNTVNPNRCGNTNQQGQPWWPPLGLVRGKRMFSLDPWRKAAECERAIERVADPERRTVLESLLNVWIEVCDSASLVEESDRVHELSIIEQIHTELMATCRMAMH
jgi:hypothetical protein